MQNLGIKHAAEFCAMMLPLPILMMECDEDRQFLIEIYQLYKPLMYKVARQFFSGSTEADDAVSSAVEHLCRKCDTLQVIACNKRASYIVSTVRNVCLTRLRQMKRQRLYLDYGPNSEALETVSGSNDVQEIVFCNLLASDLLNAFPELSEKERELIRMRHIDGQDYTDIAVLTGLSEGAARTAVCRARQKLEELAVSKRGNHHEY